MKNHVFERRKFNFIIYWLILNIIIFIALVFYKWKQQTINLAGFSIGLNLILLAILFNQYRLKSLTINKTEFKIIIELDRWFFLKKIITLPINEVKAFFREVHKARGIKARVFSIQHNNEIIIETTPGLSGWSDKILNRFIEEKNSLQ